MRSDYLIYLLVILGVALVIGLYFMHRSGHLRTRNGKIVAVVLVALLGIFAMFLPFLGIYGDDEVPEAAIEQQQG